MSKSNSPNQEDLGILKEMWEYLEDVAFCHDAEGYLIYFSPSCERVLGYTLEEVGTLNFRGVVAPEFIEDVMTRTECQMRGEAVEQPWDLQLLDKNGNRRWFQIRTRPVYDAQNRLTKVYGVARDINEKKILEKKLHEYTADLERLVKERTRTLQESEEKYRQLFENANDAVFIAQDGFIKFANPKASEMTGRSSDELTRVPFTEMIHPRDRNMVLERHRRRLKGEKLESTYSFRILNREGGELWVQLNASATSWQGEPATLNFLRDITPQKKLEVQLQQAQKMEAIGTLAGGIAHDFNNLLMAIQGNASLMLHDLDPSHPHYEALANIERLVKSGAKLTSQLLGYARKGKYEFRPINLNDLVEETSETIRRTRKEITIQKELSGDLFAIEADPVQVEQVLFNLYINAADAMPQGGELILKTSNSSHEQMMGGPYDPKPGDYVQLTVTDTGTGMDEETLRRIFDPFFTTKEMGRGTGLGLASVYGIVKGHGGYIDAESELHEGSTFRVYFPASRASILKTVGADTPIQKGEAKILLIDDEEIVLDIGAKMARKLGYAVLEARSGREAIDVFSKERDKIDLIILDMVMPDLGGVETFGRLKEIKPHVKVILSSGYSLDGQAAEMLRQGCDAFIQKPFNMTELSRKIAEVLASH